MTDKEQQRTIVMMKQLYSLGVLDNFILSLAAGSDEAIGEKNNCKKLAEMFYECVNKIGLSIEKTEYYKAMITNVLNNTNAELENHQEE